MEIDVTVLLEEIGNTLEREDVLELTGTKIKGSEVEVASDVQTDYELNNLGRGLLEFVGDYRVELNVPCSRCLEFIEHRLAEEVHGLFVPENHSGEVDLEEDQYLAYYSDKKVNVWHMLRQDFLVKIPMRPLCDEDCAGLCPECGQNLNEGDCEHEQDAARKDPRLEKLKEIDLENE